MEWNGGNWKLAFSVHAQLGQEPDWLNETQNKLAVKWVQPHLKELRNFGRRDSGPKLIEGAQSVLRVLRLALECDWEFLLELQCVDQGKTNISVECRRSLLPSAGDERENLLIGAYFQNRRRLACTSQRQSEQQVPDETVHWNSAGYLVL